MHPEALSGKESCCLPPLFRLFKKISVRVCACMCVRALVCGGRKSMHKCKCNKILTTVKLGGVTYGCPVYYAFRYFCVLETFQKKKLKGKRLCSKPISTASCPLPDPKQTFLSSFIFYPLSCTLYPSHGTSKKLTY